MFSKTGLSIVLCTFILTGCMSSNVKWREGSQPDNKDEWVRFKTNYFFRVINSCEPPKPRILRNAKDSILSTNNGYMLSDTLYRFTLTGKAHPWNAVKFEAGTLLANQIDPFSTHVMYDKTSKEIKTASVGSTASINTTNEQQTKLDTINAEIKTVAEKLDKEQAKNNVKNQTLIDSYQRQLGLLENARSEIFRFLYGNKVEPPFELSNEESKKIKNSETFRNLNDDQRDKINKDLDNNILSFSSFNSPFFELLDSKTIEKHHSKLQRIDSPSVQSASAYTRSDCPPGFSRNHGFLILGPEGWKHFDPEERLLLAMYTSEAPLISTMTKLSQKMTQAHSQTRLNEKPFQQEVQRALESQNTYLKSKEEWENKLDVLIQSFKDANGSTNNQD
ncbi:hypothetical protein HC752_09220 [Vibrio sp. S9_S30]|uniref:hypothetical protein n=1 Tax=Vibrio sp. S9_S30 TaxID=2720226 RepID=UPI00168134A4|nr:hypothetical protein [Vibrio sp. S9_S30]MBD1557119.1 hypothetical protein [Vibrio sp. S9_S30]